MFPPKISGHYFESHLTEVDRVNFGTAPRNAAPLRPEYFFFFTRFSSDLFTNGTTNNKLAARNSKITINPFSFSRP